MGDDDQRRALGAGEAHQQVGDRGGAVAVEAGRGLVRHDRAGAQQQGPGDGDPLHLAAGEGLDPPGARVEPDLREQAFGARAQVGGQAEMPEAGRQQDVLDGAEAGKEVEVLHDQADAPSPPAIPRGLGQRGDVRAVPEHAAKARPLQPGDDVDESALARAGGAGDGEARPPRELQPRQVERRLGEIGVADRDVLDDQSEHRQADPKAASRIRSRLTKPVSGSVQEPCSSTPSTSTRPVVCSKVCLRRR